MFPSKIKEWMIDSMISVKSKRFTLFPYALLSPMLVVMIVLVYYPILVTFAYSIQHKILTSPNEDRFIWFENYRVILTDRGVWKAFLNSLYVLIIALILTLVLGLLFALILKRETKIKTVLTACAIVPWALPSIVNGVLWRWVFHPSFGLVNRVLGKNIMWLTDKWLILAIVSLVLAWKEIPFACITFLATLQTIPRELYEAAEVDGSDPFHTFSRITLPLLRPAISIVLTISSIAGINVFDEIVALSGFSNITKTVMIETYLRSFKFLNFGIGSALIYMVMIVTSVIGISYVRFVYRGTEYL